MTIRTDPTRRSCWRALIACAGIAAAATACASASSDSSASRVASPAAAAAAPARVNGPLVFMRFAHKGFDDHTGQIFRRDPDGSIRQLTHFAGGAFFPAWSPDGSRIAFERWFTPARPDQLYSMKADGSDARALTRGCMRARRCLGDIDAAYSPDGNQIAFLRAYGPIVRTKVPYEKIERASRVDLMLIPASGGAPRVVRHWGLDPQPGGGGAAWSPDGRRLVVALTTTRHPSKHARQTNALHVLTLAGGAPRRITPWALGAASPDWSPDGGRIVFNSDGGHSPHIYVVGADGSGLRQLWRGAPAPQAASPVWSPDGTQVAFEQNLKPGRFNNDIYTVTADGSKATPLITSPGRHEAGPAWTALP